MHTPKKKQAVKVTQKQLAQQRRKEAGLWLRKLRERRGLSQRELAEAKAVTSGWNSAAALEVLPMATPGLDDLGHGTG
jgi:hypothetical protein